MGDVREAQRLGMNTPTSECTEEGAGPVVNEDPGQTDADREQRDVARDEGVAGSPELRVDLCGPFDQRAHVAPSVAARPGSCHEGVWSDAVRTCNSVPFCSMITPRRAPNLRVLRMNCHTDGLTDSPRH
jgi:hypothetical protein